MLYFWLFALAAFVVLDRSHRMGVNTLVRAHQFRLYALRDALREAAMRKEVNPKSWVFLYLDSSIARTISALDRMTLWHVLLTALTHYQDESSRNAMEQLQKELHKPANKILKELHDQYTAEVSLFLIDRHLSIKIALSNILTAIRVGRSLRQRWKRLIEYQMVAPETSTLRDFVHA